MDTGLKLNVHKTFRRRSRRILNALYRFNLHPVSRTMLWGKLCIFRFYLHHKSIDICCTTDAVNFFLYLFWWFRFYFVDLLSSWVLVLLFLLLKRILKISELLNLELRIHCWDYSNPVKQLRHLSLAAKSWKQLPAL